MKDKISEYQASDIIEDDNELSGSFSESEKVDHNKIDSRRKLEDYLEQKRLEKELSDY